MDQTKGGAQQVWVVDRERDKGMDDDDGGGGGGGGDKKGTRNRDWLSAGWMFGYSCNERGRAEDAAAGMRSGGMRDSDAGEWD